MPTFTQKICLAIALVTTPLYALSSDSHPKIDYPEGYQYWTHVKSAVIDDTHPLFETFGGLHNVYANKKALKALQAKSPYPDGAVFVFDLTVAEPFPDGGGLGEGKRRRLDVMVKDAEGFMSTSGWGYGSFMGNSKELLKQDASANCYACHQSQESKNYVFSEFHK